MDDPRRESIRSSGVSIHASMSSASLWFSFRGDGVWAVWRSWYLVCSGGIDALFILHGQLHPWRSHRRLRRISNSASGRSCYRRHRLAQRSRCITCHYALWYYHRSRRHSLRTPEFPPSIWQPCRDGHTIEIELSCHVSDVSNNDQLEADRGSFASGCAKTNWVRAAELQLGTSVRHKEGSRRQAILAAASYDGSRTMIKQLVGAAKHLESESFSVRRDVKQQRLVSSRSIPCLCGSLKTA